MNVKTFLLAAALSLCAATTAKSNVVFQELTLDEVRHQATQQDKLFFLYFSADWCMPCRWMDQHTFSDSRLAEYANAHYLPVKVNMDKTIHKALSERFSVTKIPTVLIFSAAGVLLERAENSLDAAAMLDLLKTYDQPTHHRRPTVTTVATIPAEPVLDSPRPKLDAQAASAAPAVPTFFRPALLPDAAEAPSQAAVEPPRPTIVTDSKLILAPQPMLVNEPIRPSQPMLASSSSVAVSPASFTPRSAAAAAAVRYGVQAAVHTDYQQAVRELTRLEAKYGQGAELYPIQENGATHYRVVLGAFDLKSEAERFHLYLRRNDILGVIITLP